MSAYILKSTLAWLFVFFLLNVPEHKEKEKESEKDVQIIASFLYSTFS